MSDLRRIRRRIGLTQAQLATLLGVGRQALCGWERHGAPLHVRRWVELLGAVWDGLDAIEADLLDVYGQMTDRAIVPEEPTTTAPFRDLVAAGQLPLEAPPRWLVDLVAERLERAYARRPTS